MDWVIVAATVVIAFSALASLWLNWRLTQDNRALRKAGSEPEVVAYLGLDERYPSVATHPLPVYTAPEAAKCHRLRTLDPLAWEPPYAPARRN